jgi:hypothetical protein
MRARFNALLQSWTKTQCGARMKANKTDTAVVGGIKSRVDIFEVAMPRIEDPEELMAIVSPLQRAAPSCVSCGRSAIAKAHPEADLGCAA